MNIPSYHIDAFTERPFAGNPAGVCFLDSWLDDALLLSIAAENNLSETAFLVKGDGLYELRWFSPKMEIDLCGHATLAGAFAVFTHREPAAASVDFLTRSGKLSVRREGDLLLMDFPSRKATTCVIPEDLGKILGGEPREVLCARDLLVVYESEEQIRGLTPEMDGIMALDQFAVIVTAPGREADFVSRFFAPKAGIPEDPVTGSSHCTLVPYWSERLGKRELHAYQLSARGGELFCTDRGERVTIGGRAVEYLSGELTVPM
jgi:predicted PhzF superfamily epimerase YddE/YHI9